MKKKIVIIAGPTCSGKTAYSIELARRFGGEIVSADSMQIYKYMDIGSAKPTEHERSLVKHYLVDEIDPSVPFSVAEYTRLAKGYINDIFAGGKIPFICGGTGLYVNALVYEMDFSEKPGDEEFRRRASDMLSEHGPEYLHEMLKAKDPAAAERIHPNNTKKVIRALEILEGNGGAPLSPFSGADSAVKDYDTLIIGINRPREELYDRINRRVDIMMNEGLEDEVKKLMSLGLSRDNISMMGIGYKEMIACLEGEMSREEARELIQKNTRHLAKRQMTWFRRYDDMVWFDVDEASEAEDIDRIFDMMSIEVEKYLAGE